MGVLIFYSPGSIEQLSVGLALAVLFIAWYHHLQPYESDWDDRLQFLCQCTVFAALVYATTVQVRRHPIRTAISPLPPRARPFAASIVVFTISSRDS